MKKAACVLCICLLLSVWYGAAGIEALAADDIAAKRNFVRGNICVSPRSNTYFIQGDGSLWSAGWDSAGHDVTPILAQNAPQKVMENVQAVQNSDWSTLALDHADTLWAWGNNANGNQGTDFISAVPAKILDAVSSFDLGGNYTLAVRKDGTLWFWGFMHDVNQKDPTQNPQYLPVQIMADVKRASAGGPYGLAIKNDDSLWTWTSAWDDYQDRWVTSPVKVMDGVASASNGMAIGLDGTLWGFEVDYNAGKTLTPVRLLDNVADTGRSGSYYLARDKQNALWAWPFDHFNSGAVMVAGDCAYFVAVCGQSILYINTHNTLCQVELKDSTSKALQVEKDVLYAAASHDSVLLCVKLDGSLLLRPLLNLADSKNRATAAKDVMLAPLQSSAGGLPTDPTYLPEWIPVNQFRDTSGHWAEKAILRWAGYGVLRGDQVAFRPDDPVTRAEFSAVLNRVMGYKPSGAADFKDVVKTAWYYDDITRVYAAGVLEGDGKGSLRPLDHITHEEACVMLARAFSLKNISNNAVQFENVSYWANEAVSTMSSDGYLPVDEGYVFEAQKPITRAGVAAILDRLIALYIDEAVYFGDVDKRHTIKGNVLINTNSVSLRNMTISGNIYLAPGIGDYFTKTLIRDVVLDGTLYVNCPGLRVTLRDSEVPRLIVQAGELAKITTTGQAEVKNTVLRSSVRLTEEHHSDSGAGFENILIPADCRGTDVVLDGSFAFIENRLAGCRINITGAVDVLYAAEETTLAGEHGIGKTYLKGEVPQNRPMWEE